MENVKEVKFRKITDNRGALTPLQYPDDIPFEIKRVYYIYDVQEGVERGFHSHKNLEQILIALGGNIKVRTKTPYEEKVFLLDNPSKGLYIGPYIWREMFDFSPNSTLLVLASHEYDENDYFRDYNEYEKEYKLTRKSKGMMKLNENKNSNFNK